VPFKSLFLDPNNPRLAMDGPPGYDDPKHLFDPNYQEQLVAKVKDVYDVSGLETAIENQGWMPIDSIVVWKHPSFGDRYVVAEGNTRTVVLRGFRDRLPQEKKKLERLKGARKAHAQRDIEEQEQRIKRIEQIIADTEMLTVLPLAAKDIQELR